jgi:hypothetical protein
MEPPLRVPVPVKPGADATKRDLTPPAAAVLEKRKALELEFLTPLFSGIPRMLAKKTAKNQLTLPKAILKAVGDADYFDVSAEEGRIVLTPVRVQRADAVRAKLESLGITEGDVQDAIEWARSR